MYGIQAPRPTPTSEALAWAAGIIDGEGCISIVERHDAKNTCFALSVTVANCDPRMLFRLRELFGGYVKAARTQAKPEHRPAWHWGIYSASAAWMVGLIRPHLVIKGEQADIAIEFAQTIKRPGGSHSRKPLEPGVKESRQDMKTRITALKRVSWPEQEVV